MDTDAYNPSSCDVFLSLLKNRLKTSRKVQRGKGISQMIEVIENKVTDRSKLFTDIVGAYSNILGKVLTDQENEWIATVLRKQLETNFMESKLKMEKLNLFHKILGGGKVTGRKILLCIETFLQLATALAINNKSSAIDVVEWLAKTVDTVPLNSSHLTVLGWMNTSGGWIQVMCQNERPEEKATADVNQSHHFQTNKTHADEKDIQRTNQTDPEKAEKSNESFKGTSVPTEKIVRPDSVKDKKLTSQAPVRPPQTGLPIESEIRNSVRFIPCKIIQDGVEKLKRTCKKCWRDQVFPLEQYRGVCGNCNQHLCLIKNCGVARRNDSTLTTHLQTHRNEDLTKCFECGAGKVRSVGQDYAQCQNCFIFWCLGNNCGQEFPTKLAIKNHHTKMHRKT